MSREKLPPLSFRPNATAAAAIKIIHQANQTEYSAFTVTDAIQKALIEYAKIVQEQQQYKGAVFPKL
jgi:hypothetical protein